MEYYMLHTHLQHLNDHLPSKQLRSLNMLKLGGEDSHCRRNGLRSLFPDLPRFECIRNQKVSQVLFDCVL